MEIVISIVFYNPRKKYDPKALDAAYSNVKSDHRSSRRYEWQRRQPLTHHKCE